MSKKILAFGEVMMRLQVPGYELLEQANTLHYTFSGTGVNIASALSRFGYESHLMTTLPNNAVGDAAAAYLQKLGIRPDFIERGGSGVGMYFLENGFGLRPSRVTYSNRSESSFNNAPIDSYPFKDAARQMDLTHFCGISLSMNDEVRQQMKTLARHVKEEGGMVLFDCNFRPLNWGENGYEAARKHYEDMLHLADIVMMNERDAIHLLGMHTKKTVRQEQLIELIPQVAERFHIQVIAGTHRTILNEQSHSLLGYIYKDGQFAFSAVKEFSVLDRIGTGDAFTSGIVHGLIQEFPNEKTVEFAAVSSMLSHTTVGDTPVVSESEIMRTMSGMVSDVIR